MVFEIQGEPQHQTIPVIHGLKPFKRLSSLDLQDGINGTYHVNPCTEGKCSAYYHDQDQTPEHPKGDGSCTDMCDCGSLPCGEYLWDHRNASLREWLVEVFVWGLQP